MAFASQDLAGSSSATGNIRLNRPFRLFLSLAIRRQNGRNDATSPANPCEQALKRRMLRRQAEERTDRLLKMHNLGSLL